MTGRVPASSGARTAEGSDAVAGHSMAIAAWTAVSRGTGLLRVVTVAAVLGPTVFGNVYLATNLLPNITYEFLTGSLFASLLVPALVRHVDAGDRRAAERIAGGFLGLALVAFALVALVVVAAGPLLLSLFTLSADASTAAAQRSTGWLLLVLLMPQLLFYGVVGTGVAVQNSRGRFAVPAAAPAVENIGIICTLGAYAAVFGTGTSIEQVTTSHLMLLGLGTTASVASHAAVQWWGARAVGVTLRPRFGWRDEEVRAIVRLAVPSLGYAGLNATRLIGILAVAATVPGGVVAFQLAVNFYNLPVALGGRPIAQALLPQLSRLRIAGAEQDFRDSLVRGAAMTAFLTVPAATAYVVLSEPLAHAVSYGAMATATGITLVALSLAGLGAGVVGEAGTIVATHASYARRDARSPLQAMAVRTGVSLIGMTATLLFLDGPVVLLGLGLSVAVADWVGLGRLGIVLARSLPHEGERLAAPLARAVVAALTMVGPAYITAVWLSERVADPFGGASGILGAAVIGMAIYVGMQRLMRSPELRSVAGGMVRLRPGGAR